MGQHDPVPAFSPCRPSTSTAASTKDLDGDVCASRRTRRGGKTPHIGRERAADLDAIADETLRFPGTSLARKSGYLQRHEAIVPGARTLGRKHLLGHGDLL